MPKPSRQFYPDDRHIYVGRVAPAEMDKTASRSDRHNALRAHNARVRQKIEDWIVQTGMTEHIKLLPVGKVFNVLFFRVDDEGQELIGQVPGVLEVSPRNDLDVDLLDSGF